MDNVPLQSSKVSIGGHDVGTPVSKQSQICNRSLSMAEAMLQPQSLEQPIPIALRVRDAGRAFLKHDQTCQWIQFIQDHDPDPPRRGSGLYSSIPVPNCNSNSHERKNNAPLGLQELGESSIDDSCIYEEKLRSLQKQQEELLQRQHQLEDQLEQQKRSQETHSPEALKKAMGECESFVDPEHSQTSHLVQNSNSLRLQPSKFRRRLKGSVAQSYAQRSEGCLEGLLYYMDSSEIQADRSTHAPFVEHSYCKDVSAVPPVEATCNRATPAARNFSTTSREAVHDLRASWGNNHMQDSALSKSSRGSSAAIMGRRQAMSQESGIAVSQLLLQPSCPTYNPLMRSVNDSSVTDTSTNLYNKHSRG